MIPVQLIGAAVIAVTSFGAAWTYQGNRYERVIAEQRAAQSALLVEAYANAKRETERMAQAKDEAERKHQSRLADLRRDAAGVRVVADRLRDELATSRIALPNSTCTSAVEYATTLNTVFGECTAEVGRLAEAASGHSADAVMLRDAWPSPKP